MMDPMNFSRASAEDRLSSHRARAETAIALLELADIGAMPLSFAQRALIGVYYQTHEQLARLAGQQINPTFPVEKGPDAHA